MASSPVDKTRERLIAATTSCLAKYGIAKTGVIDIVREAGSSRQTAYRYFSGRRELIYHALLRAGADMLERLPGTVGKFDDPIDVLIETILFLFRELPGDPILSQVFGPGALTTLQPLASDQAVAVRLSRVALESYRNRVGELSDHEMDLLAEHVNRLILSAMLIAQGDSLLQADDAAREKLEAWFGPTVERHLAAACRRRGRPAAARPA